jgi:hypothetical protein
MNQYTRNLIIGVFTLVLVACSRKTVDLLPQVKLDRKKTPELVAKMDSLFLLKPSFFYSKIATQYQDTNQNLSFKTSVKMVKDSAVSALITYAAIPVFNSLLTPDSLTIVNKREKCYSKAKLATLKESFGYEFEYKNIEELLLGLPLDYDTNQKYFQIHDPYNYILSSHKKREIRRTDKGKPLNKVNSNDIIIKYYLSADIKSIKQIDIESPDDSTEIKVNYLSREMIDGFNIPKEVEVIVLRPKNKIKIHLNYEKIEVNQRQALVLIIPESYEICE